MIKVTQVDGPHTVNSEYRRKAHMGMTQSFWCTTYKEICHLAILRQIHACYQSAPEILQLFHLVCSTNKWEIIQPSHL